MLSFAARFVLNQRRAQRWSRQLENARQVTIESMAAVAETRDPEAGGHIKRTQHYVRAVAWQLKRAGEYARILNKEYIDLFCLRHSMTSGRSGCRTISCSSPGR